MIIFLCYSMSLSLSSSSFGGLQKWIIKMNYHELWCKHEILSLAYNHFDLFLSLSSLSIIGDIANTNTDTNTNTGLIKLWWFAEMKSWYCGRSFSFLLHCAADPFHLNHNFYYYLLYFYKSVRYIQIIMWRFTPLRCRPFWPQSSNLLLFTIFLQIYSL